MWDNFSPSKARAGAVGWVPSECRAQRRALSQLWGLLLHALKW